MSPLNNITKTHLEQRLVGSGGLVRGKDVHPLLRVLRSRGRGFVRFAESLPRLRRGLGHMLAVGLIVTGWGYGSAVGGSGGAFVSGVAATVGLSATDITISGQVESSEQNIFAALDVGRSLVGFDAAKARARLLQLPWVKDVAIRKVFPGKLTVAIVEKRAMAVWQHQDRLTVVGSTGEKISKFGIADLISNRYSYLPHLVGEGAAEAANEILPLVVRHPTLAGRVASYVRVANRRWDMEMTNGLRIKLPEYGAAEALTYVADMAASERLLEREISVIDMRISDRVVLRLDEVAAKTRAELVSARLEAMKKADRKL